VVTLGKGKLTLVVGARDRVAVYINSSARSSVDARCSVSTIRRYTGGGGVTLGKG